MNIGPTGVALCLCTLLLAGPSVRSSDPLELPRRGFLGAAVEPVAAGGVRLLRVIPSSTASTLGLTPGDEIVQVDGQAVADVPQFLRLVGAHQSGDAIRLLVRRGDDLITREGRMAAFPRETRSHSEVLYRHARHPDPHPR